MDVRVDVLKTLARIVKSAPMRRSVIDGQNIWLQLLYQSQCEEGEHLLGEMRVNPIQL